LVWVDIDCAQPPVPAEFYHQVLGWDVLTGFDEYAVISDGSSSIRFGRVDN